MAYKPYVFKEQDIIDFARFVGIRHKIHGNEVFFEKCPYCNGISSTGIDKKTFSINRENGRYKCFRDSCGAQGNMINLSKDFGFSLGNEVDEYYMPKKKFKRIKTPEKPIVPKQKAIDFLESRGISKEIAQKYEITVQSERDNILVFPFYDEKGLLQFVKYRKTDFDKNKDSCKEWCEEGCKPILFGMKQCNMENKTLIITEGQCFNGDAEIMTRNGWVRLEDYCGQEVLQVNKDMTSKFVIPKAYIVKEYDGDMVNVSIGGNYYTSTTTDHNLVFTDGKGRLVKRKAEEKIPTNYHIPTAVMLNEKSCSLSDSEIALMIAISADGTIDKRKNGSYYARFGLSKERKVKRLIHILEKLGYDYTDNVYNQGNRSYHSICFTVQSEILAKKFLPWFLVTETSVEQKKKMIEEMVFWNGNHVNNRNQYEYMSMYKNNADVMQAIASTCGYMSTIMKKKSGGNGHFKESFCYKVSILLGKKNVSTQQFEKHKTRRSVNKTVYCVSVDSGMILVRQNNKISVSGNCDTLAVAESGIENAVSVPTGSKGFTWVPYCWNWICNFDQIIIFGDYEKGHITLLDEFVSRFGFITIKHVKEEDYIDCKDANEILRRYGKEQIQKCIKNAVAIPVKDAIDLADVEDVDIFSLEKLETGLNDIDRLLYGGLPFGGVHIVSGKPGEGKSTLASQIMINAIENGYTCFAYSGELPNYLFKAWTMFQIAGGKHISSFQNKWGDTNYTMPEKTKNEISEWLRGKYYIYDNSKLDGEEKESLVKTCEKMIVRYGVRVILLDNLMTAMDLEDVSGNDKYEKQSQFVKKLSRIALRYNVIIILVAHKRKNNVTTNENDEISGSGDISNLALVTIAYEKNTDIEPNQRICKVSKNRLFGKTNTKGWTLDYEEKSKRIYGPTDNVNVKYGWDKSDTQYGFDAINFDIDEIPFAE